ncbi:MAG: hypothetical protein V1917_04115 [Candidatus Gottesmanbacteria bacterium]
MATDNLSKVTTLAALQSFAKEQGLDLNQAPSVDDNESGRRAFRRWIRKMLIVSPAIQVEEQAVVETPVVIPEESETPQLVVEVIKPVVEPEHVEPEPAKSYRWLWWGVGLILVILVGILIFRGCSNATTPVATATARPTTIVVATKTLVPTSTQAAATKTLVPTKPAVTQPANTSVAPVTDGKKLAESILGKILPWPVPAYVSGKPGFPEICAGLCWDKFLLDKGILVWYGPSDGSEDITQSDVKFGDGTDSPIELMRNGEINTVIFANGLDAQMEVCAINGSTLDGKLIADWLKEAGITEQCGRFAIPAGWHVVKNNMNAPIAGFGVRLSASGWASMTEPQIVQYNKYWTIDGKTATWVGPKDVEVMMTPAMVSMMQDFGSLTEIVWTTTGKGTVLFCNGKVEGSIQLTSPDGACRVYNVPSGTFTYTGEQRTSAGISWQPAVK